MFTSLIATVGLLMALMAAWIEVQRAARRVAEQHPEAGPLRLVGGGCGGHGHGDEAAPASEPERPAVMSEPAARAPCCRRLRGLRQHGLQARRADGGWHAGIPPKCSD